MNVELYTEAELRRIPGISPPLECLLPDIKTVKHGQTLRVYYRNATRYTISAYRDEFNEGFTLTVQRI